MTTTTDEIPGVRWIVDYSVEPPERLVQLDFDSATIISLIDIADAATFAGGQHTRNNAAAVRDYLLRVNRELESRSLQDHTQWAATKHLDGDE
jgi:hypothetical protein